MCKKNNKNIVIDNYFKDHKEIDIENLRIGSPLLESISKEIDVDQESIILRIRYQADLK